jgi:hypothetical protein
MIDLWIWVRVPLRGLERAIDALKERVANLHTEASKTPDPKSQKALRAEADEDEAYAETLKQAIRDEDGPPPGKEN